MLANRRLAPAAAALALLGAALVATGLGNRPDDSVRIVLLHTNDLHGQLLPRMVKGRGGDEAVPIGGFAALASAVARERAAAERAGAHVLLVDSGDWFQGTPEGNFEEEGVAGIVAVEGMNRIGFDAAVIGNHEFDFGLSNLRALLGKVRFAALGANIVAPVAVGASAPAAPKGRDAKAPIARPYEVFERGGIRIAVVGLLTDDTPRMVAAGRLGDVTIRDERTEARLWVDRARKEADLVVLATHCGSDVDSKLAERVPEVPVILGGHNHVRLKQPRFVEHEAAALAWNPWKPDAPPRTYVLQSGAKCENLDRVELWIDPADKKLRRVETKVYTLDPKEVGSDAAMERWLAERTAGVAKAMDVVVARVAAPPSTAAKGERTDPTANFLADAMLASARGVDPSVVAALSNRGGVRAKLSTGELTMRQIYEIVPFDNTLVLLTLSGSDLLDLVLDTARNPRGSIPLPAGLTGRVAERADGSWDTSELRIGGAALEPARAYRVATNSFMASGKGGYPGFLKGADVRDTGILLRDAMAELARERKTLVLDDVLRLRADRRGKAAETPEEAPAEEPAPAGAGGGKR